MSAMLQFSFELRGKLRVAGTFMPGAGGGGGGGATQQSFIYGEAPPGGLNPYPFIYHF